MAFNIRKRHKLRYYADEWRFFKVPRSSFSIPKPRGKAVKKLFDGKFFGTFEEELSELPKIPADITLDTEAITVDGRKVVVVDKITDKRKSGKFNARHASVTYRNDLEMPSLPSLASCKAKADNRYVKILQNPHERIPDLPIVKPSPVALNASIKNLIGASQAKPYEHSNGEHISQRLDTELTNIRKIIYNLT